MLTHFKALLRDILADVMATLLHDLLYFMFNLIDSKSACLAVFAKSLCTLT